MKYLILLISIITWFYMGGAFATWELNPALWSPYCRIGVFVMGTTLAAACSFLLWLWGKNQELCAARLK